MPTTDAKTCGLDKQIRRLFVRFENMAGEGLYRVSRDILDSMECGMIRVRRKTLREARDLFYRLWAPMASVPRAAYLDARSRSPITWFIGTESDALQIAERLVRMLNRYGADLRRIETDRPPKILWEDGFQAVTRRLRRPAPRYADVVKSRWRDRRRRLQKRRERAGRTQARAAKSGL